MKYLSLQKILHYLYNKFTGSFLGFLIGSAAASLMSRFFETRSIKNLWGLASKKRVLDKQTFSNIEWILSIIIGFIVFEIVTKVIKKKIDEKFPMYKIRFMRWMIRNEMHIKLRKAHFQLNEKRIALFTTMHAGTKNAMDRYSKK